MCDFCGAYDFRQAIIYRLFAAPSIGLVGALQPLINGCERFQFCPKCGRKLTPDDFTDKT